MKPILFSTLMVQAILAGRKTQTRRVSGLEVVNECPNDWIFVKSENGIWFFNSMTAPNCWCELKPKYQPGDILYVRETFKQMFYEDGSKEIFYRAQFGPEPVDWNWQPNIFMPKEAARIFLQVTDVRAERLQDISEVDAIAEGIEVGNHSRTGETIYKSYAPDAQYEFSPKESFCSLWQSINVKKCPWDSNPWVWVYTFKKIQKP